MEIMSYQKKSERMTEKKDCLMKLFGTYQKKTQLQISNWQMMRLVAAGALSGTSVVVGYSARYNSYKATGVTKPKAVLVTYGSHPRHMDALKQL
eukprot:15334135-Ditylum_brightwellii.AAC.1